MKPARPPKLAVIQRAITDALMHPLTRDDEIGPESAEIAAEFIKPNDRLSAFERLQIYNQQYWWRLLGALQEDFRGVRAVLGAWKFEKLAETYLASCPSRSWTLRDLGQRLPAYIENHPHLTLRQTALATDVARVEWARVIAFDGEEKPVISPSRIAKIPTDRLHLGLQPYLSLLELAYPVDDLLRQVKHTTIAAMSNAVAPAHTRRGARLTVRRSARPVHLAVHRVAFAVYYKRLEPEAFRLLCALRDGATLDAACALAFAQSKELPEQSAAKLQEWFARWMEFGWFCRR